MTKDDEDRAINACPRCRCMSVLGQDWRDWIDQLTALGWTGGMQWLIERFAYRIVACQDVAPNGCQRYVAYEVAEGEHVATAAARILDDIHWDRVSERPHEGYACEWRTFEVRR